MTQVNTGTEDLLAEINEGVGLITLNRPEARNAMSGAMNTALAATLADFELNPAVKVIVLTGAGKGFCAGGDVKGMAASGDGTVETIRSMARFIANGSCSVRRPESFLRCQSLRSLPCRVPQLAPVSHSRWRATCVSWRQARS